MSFKSKNLEFDAGEPAFLRRLRGQARGNIDDPDRHTNPTVLSKAPKRLENDDEDAPTYVVEGSNDTLSKEEYEKLITGKSEEHEPMEEIKAIEASNDANDTKDASKSLKTSHRVAEAGVMSKKRKATKVVGDEDETETSESKADTKSKPASKKAKAKSRSKSVKLSFDDEEAG